MTNRPRPLSGRFSSKTRVSLDRVHPLVEDGRTGQRGPEEPSLARFRSPRRARLERPPSPRNGGRSAQYALDTAPVAATNGAPGKSRFDRLERWVPRPSLETRSGDVPASQAMQNVTAFKTDTVGVETGVSNVIASIPSPGQRSPSAEPSGSVVAVNDQLRWTEPTRTRLRSRSSQARFVGARAQPAAFGRRVPGGRCR